MQKIRKVPRADYGKPHFGPQNPRKKLISHFFLSQKIRLRHFLSSVMP